LPSRGHREALAEYAREIEFVGSVDHALRARIFIELQQRIGEAHLRLGEATEGGPRSTSPSKPMNAECAPAPMTR
jgi:hypothetical protein